MQSLRSDSLRLGDAVTWIEKSGMDIARNARVSRGAEHICSPPGSSEQIQRIVNIPKKSRKRRIIPGGGLILIHCRAKVTEDRPDAAYMIADVDESF